MPTTITNIVDAQKNIKVITLELTIVANNNYPNAIVDVINNLAEINEEIIFIIQSQKIYDFVGAYSILKFKEKCQRRLNEIIKNYSARQNQLTQNNNLPIKDIIIEKIVIQ